MSAPTIIDTAWHPLTTGCPPRWASGWGQDRYGVFVEFAFQDVTQRLRWIPPGRFWMGSTQEETRDLPKDETERVWFDAEHPRHQVTLTDGYWLFDTLCTQVLWTAVMGKNPSRFQSPTRPVENVTWHDAQEFIGQLNKLIVGLELVLPSEAQWEYACRAGTETAIYSGALDILGGRNAPALDPIAWYGGNSGVDFELDNGADSSSWPEKQYPHTKAGTRPVKLKRANPWGLYDMLGNVWEWTQDPWHDDYTGAPVDGSAWEDRAAGANRVLRGGSWYDYARGVRAAYRIRNGPVDRLDSIGFRCARVQAVSSSRQASGRRG